MLNHRKYLQILTFALINTMIFAFIGNKSKKRYPAIRNTVNEIERHGNSRITIAGSIKDSFPCIYNLLKEVTTFDNQVYSHNVLNSFWVSDKIDIVFVDETLPEKVEANSDSANLFQEDGRFRVKIVLNRIYLRRASRDYLVSIIMHEGLHAYIKWCILSYTERKNGITKDYLKKHFPNHWRWLTYGYPYITEYAHHVLMSENYIDEMVRNIYPFTNPESPVELRNTVALCFAWGGLHDTPAWKKSSFDTCYVHSVNGWARSMNAPDTARFYYGKCVPKPKSFLDTLQLRFPCH